MPKIVRFHETGEPDVLKIEIKNGHGDHLTL